MIERRSTKYELGVLSVIFSSGVLAALVFMDVVVGVLTAVGVGLLIRYKERRR